MRRGNTTRPHFTRGSRPNLDPFRWVRLYHRLPPAGWQSGYAADCKSAHSGSIPLPASKPLYLAFTSTCRLARILIAPPPLFPRFVAHLGAIVPPDVGRDGDIEIPASLAKAVASRRAEFVAGRLCARDALAALGAPSTTVPRGGDGAPEWPAGFVGSISHTAGFAFAAVARVSEARGLGLDVERISRFETDLRITRIVATPAERARFDLAAGNLATLFSAKEAVYKCLYPLLHKFLEFDAIELDAITADGFACHPTRQLSPEFGPDTLIEGRYLIVDGLIHTGVLLR